MKPRGTLRGSTFKPQDERKRKRQQQTHDGSALYVAIRRRNNRKKKKSRTKAKEMRFSIQQFDFLHSYEPLSSPINWFYILKENFLSGRKLCECQGGRGPQNRMPLSLITICLWTHAVNCKSSSLSFRMGRQCNKWWFCSLKDWRSKHKLNIHAALIFDKNLNRGEKLSQLVAFYCTSGLL